MSSAQQRADHAADPGIQLLGREQGPLIIIDEFSTDPERLVDYAATRCSFSPVTANLYPGVRARPPEDYIKEVLSKVEELVRSVYGLQDTALAGGQCSFSLVTTPPEKLRPLQRVPHFDNTNLNQLAVLHYLCPEEHGGTSFYRHRSTGFEIITKERCDTYKARLNAEINASSPPPPAYIDGDTPLFERIGRVQARFNRMVVYRSANLHSGNIPHGFRFERDARKGRLTLNTFLVFGPHGETMDPMRKTPTAAAP